MEEMASQYSLNQKGAVSFSDSTGVERHIKF